MTVRQLVRMLKNETIVIIKDLETGNILFSGYASAACFEDRVVDWDFSNEYVLYINLTK